MAVDAVETAIAHHQHGVTVAGFTRDGLDQHVQVVARRQATAQRRQRTGRVPAQPTRVAEHRLCIVEAASQGILPDALLHGVGARLQNRQDAAAADPLAQRGHGLGDGCGVMGKVVDHRHAAHRAAVFKAPLDVAEARKGIDRRLWRDPGMARSGDGRQRVHAVVPAQDAPAQRRDVLASVADRKGRSALAGARPLGARPATTDTEMFDRCPAALLQGRREVGVGAVDHQQALARHRAYQVMELGLDRRQVGEDIGVVELEIVEDCRPRPVVDELAAFVEERGVVLVSLDDKERTVGEPRRDGKVLWHAADQEAGGQPGILEDPGQHRGGGGLAVRAGDGQHPLVAQHRLGQPLRAGHVGQPTVKDRLHQRVAAADHVADHIHVGLRLQLRRVPALRQGDTQLLELGAHRRVDVGVATGNGVARLLGDGGDAAHEGAADAEDVDVHAQVKGLCVATPLAAKSAVFRVTTVKLCRPAMAAICVSTGCPGSAAMSAPQACAHSRSKSMMRFE